LYILKFLAKSSCQRNEPGKKKQQIGKAVLWSSIREGSLYKKREAPFVMAVATSRPDKGKPFTPESPTCEFQTGIICDQEQKTQFSDLPGFLSTEINPDEFSAEEFGLYHPYLNVSIPIEHLGSTYTATSPESQRCVAGFDNAG
jgi:lysophospholipase